MFRSAIRRGLWFRAAGKLVSIHPQWSNDDLKVDPANGLASPINF